MSEADSGARARSAPSCGGERSRTAGNWPRGAVLAAVFALGCDPSGPTGRDGSSSPPPPPACGEEGGPPELSPDCMDWFVLAGQSNMVGHSTQPTQLEAVWPAYSFRIDDELLVAEDPWIHRIHPSGKDASAWPRFASRWTQERDRGVGLVATAAGGTCLAARAMHWDAGSGIRFMRMVDQTRQAMQLPGAPAPLAVLWLQGECEVAAGTDFAIYYDALLALADAIDEELGLPMVVAPVSLSIYADDPSLDPTDVHDAAVAAAEDHPGIFLGPALDDLTLEPDGAHIHDVNELGERWFDVVAQWVDDSRAD